MFRAKIPNSSQVSFLRNDYSTFSLDWLDAHSANVWVVLELLSQVLDIIVLEQFKAVSEGAEVGVSGRVVTGT